MPTYCYTTDDGETVYQVRSIRSRNRAVVLSDGRRARRDVSAEGRTPARRCRDNGNVWRQHRSIALGVNVNQIPEAERIMHGAGIDVTYDRQTGEAVYPPTGGHAEKNKHMRFLGMGNQDPGHGDPVPSDFPVREQPLPDVSDPGRSVPSALPHRFQQTEAEIHDMFRSATK